MDIWKGIHIITLTSYWPPRRLKSPALRLFTQSFIRAQIKKTSKLRVTGLCAGNSPGAVNSLHKWSVTWKMFPFDDVIIFWVDFGILITHWIFIVVLSPPKKAFVSVLKHDRHPVIMGGLGLIWKKNPAIDFNLYICAHWMNIEKLIDFRSRSHIFGSLTCKTMDQIWSFLALSAKQFYSVGFRLPVCEYWVNIEKQFDFRPVVKYLAPGDQQMAVKSRT